VVRAVKRECLVKDDDRYIVFYSATPAEEKTKQEAGGGTVDDRAERQTVLRERDEKAGED
jgi:hypothetical protein